MSLIMAEVIDRDTNRKKYRRDFQKPGGEFEISLSDTMRSPMIQGASSKYSSSYSNHYMDQSNSHGWERRGGGGGNGRYNHEDWDKPRGSFSSGSGSGIMRRNDASRPAAAYSRDSGRPPGRIIGDGDGEGEKENASVAPAPVILSRSRSTSEPRASSPTTTVAPSTIRKEGTPSGATTSTTASGSAYQIASKPAIPESQLTPERVFRWPVKLLDDTLSFGEDLSPFLVDASHYLVVAVVGMQGVGKSTIASLLIDPMTQVTNTRTYTFRPETIEQVMSGCHSTSGLDVYVTKQRLIVLDCQPLLSPSIMDRIITQEKKFATTDYSSTENLMEVESLQLLTMILSIAQVVICVSDGGGAEANLLRLLHTAEMMKPPGSSSNNSTTQGGSGSVAVAPVEDTHQYFPHVVFVHNRAPPHHFTPSYLNKMQNVYREAMSGSYLDHESRVGLCNGIASAPLNQTSCGSLINLFLLPDFNKQHRSPVSFLEAISEMRRQVLSMRRNPLTHLTLTEKSWYQYVQRTWESVRKWSLFSEYSRLLP